MSAQSAQSARPTIDLDPPAAARPGLALVLALLSVPGVVITWDLVPGGGFTTGVPLGIAAIVLGLQARARLGGAPGTRMALSAIIVAGLAVLSVVFFMIAGSPDSDAQAQAPAGQTIVLKELEQGSTFKHVRNTKTHNQRSIALGDLIVFTNPLTDASGARLGRLHASCVTTVGNASFLKGVLACSGVLALRDGSLMLQTTTSPGVPTTTGAVVGGTGAYAGARGVLVSKESKTGSDDTITLAG
ncbi:MAG TPA: dirigent protein [Solirubrobacteraceae bacterium]|nr:dirigent protein [Solirubrobacteraceae bacterium]